MSKFKNFKQRRNFLIFSIFINSAGNALAISSNLGSAVWMASGVNLSKWVHIPLGTTLLIYGIVITIMNQVLIGHFSRWRFFSNLLFVLPFSYFVEWFTYLWDWVGVPDASLPIRIILDLIGLATVAAAVSIYQRANILMHPNDDLSYILRFKYLKGSAVWGQWLSYSPPVIIMVISYLATGHLSAVGFGTFWALATQGGFMQWSDAHVFKRLKHHVNFG